MATYAISDLHGCKTQFDKLLQRVSPSEEDDIWVLGDLCDRGPESAALLKWAAEEPDGFHFLLGNHEDMAGCVICRNPDKMSMRMSDPWSFNRGYDTAEDLYETTDPLWREQVLAPWMEKLSPFSYIEVDGRGIMLVHAGFDPSAWDKDAESHFIDGIWDQHSHHEDIDVGHGFGVQNEQDMVWIRNAWLMYRKDAPLTTIFGHTPTNILAEDSLWPTHGDSDAPKLPTDTKGRIWHTKNRWNIDCGCAYNGRLAMLRLDDMEEFYVDGYTNEW